MDITPVRQKPLVRLAVIACGSARQNYGPALMELPVGSVSALMDPDPVSARLWARHLGRPHIATDIQSVLSPDLADAVIVTSPLSARVAETMQVIERGIPVLVDTPPALELHEVDGLRSASSLVMVAQPRRHDPWAARVKELLDAGEIGQARMVRCTATFPSPWATRSRSLESWAGVLSLHGHQTVDLCRYWLGPVHSVSGDIDPEPEESSGTEIANLILRHDIATSVHHICRSATQAGAEHYLLQGDRGTLALSYGRGWAYSDGEPPSLALARPGCDPVQLDPPADADARYLRLPAYRAVLGQFMGLVKAGITGTVGMEDALAGLRILETGLRSTRRRIRITVSSG